MNKTTLIIVILVFTTICKGQTSQTKYFSSVWLDKEVPENKAKFSQTITQNIDGTTTTDVINLKKNEVVRSETYKGKEPYGIWKFRYGNGYQTINYNFPLIYSDETCHDSLSFTTKDYFQNNDSLGYKCPKLTTGESSISEFLWKNIFYPAWARDRGIQGTVYLQLTLSTLGAENIVVQRGVDISLDKEAVRVIRELKFCLPATVNGQTCVFNCLVLPIKFKLM